MHTHHNGFNIAEIGSRDRAGAMTSATLTIAATAQSARWRDHRRSVLASLAPEDPVQEALARRIVRLTWRMNEEALDSDGEEAIPSFHPQDEKAAREADRREAHLDRSLCRLLAEFRRLRKPHVQKDFRAVSTSIEPPTRAPAWEMRSPVVVIEEAPAPPSPAWAPEAIASSEAEAGEPPLEIPCAEGLADLVPSAPEPLVAPPLPPVEPQHTPAPPSARVSALQPQAHGAQQTPRVSERKKGSKAKLPKRRWPKADPEAPQPIKAPENSRRFELTIHTVPNLTEHAERFRFRMDDPLRLNAPDPELTLEQVRALRGHDAMTNSPANDRLRE